MRARRSSRSASGVSIVNGRIAVASAVFSAMTAMWILLGIAAPAPVHKPTTTARQRAVTESHCGGRQDPLLVAPRLPRRAQSGVKHSPTTGGEVKPGRAPASRDLLVPRADTPRAA